MAANHDHACSGSTSGNVSSFCPQTGLGSDDLLTDGRDYRSGRQRYSRMETFTHSFDRPPYLVVYLCYLLQQFIYVQFATLVFTENVIPFCKISLLTCAAMICLSLVLIPRWGMWGLVLSPFIAETIFSAWIVIRRGFTSQSMGLHQFFRHALLGPVLNPIPLQRSPTPK